MNMEICSYISLLLIKHNAAIAWIISFISFIYFVYDLYLLSPPVERDLSGSLLAEARCETCQGSAPALSVPNSNKDR